MTQARSKSQIVLLLLIFGFFVASQSLAQRGGRRGPPRRMVSHETITLDSGARIEFKKFQSQALGREMRYSIYLPASYDSSSQAYPVVYFLHGMNNDETSWCVERYGKPAPGSRPLDPFRKGAGIHHGPSRWGAQFLYRCSGRLS